MDHTRGPDCERSLIEISSWSLRRSNVQNGRALVGSRSATAGAIRRRPRARRLPRGLASPSHQTPLASTNPGHRHGRADSTQHNDCRRTTPTIVRAEGSRSAYTSRRDGPCARAETFAGSQHVAHPYHQQPCAHDPRVVRADDGEWSHDRAGQRNAPSVCRRRHQDEDHDRAHHLHRDRQRRHAQHLPVSR